MWHPSRTGLSLACCLMLYLPGMVIGQGDTDADTREVTQYALTAAGLNKFRRAAENLAPLHDRLAANCDNDEDDSSLGALVSRIQSIPGAGNAIESAGMPIREFVIFMFSAIQTGLAAWALDQPGGTLAPGVSMANVDFYRAHEDELQEAASVLKSDGCDDAEDDSYEDEDDGYVDDE